MPAIEREIPREARERSKIAEERSVELTRITQNSSDPATDKAVENQRREVDQANKSVVESLADESRGATDTIVDAFDGSRSYTDANLLDKSIDPNVKIVAERLETASSTLQEDIKQTIENVDPKTLENLKPVLDDIKARVEDIKNALDKNLDVTQQVENLKSEFTRLENEIKNKPDIDKKLTSKYGDFGKKVLLYLLGIGAIVGGIFLALKLIADSLSGCYMIESPNEPVKLECSDQFKDSDKNKFCACGQAKLDQKLTPTDCQQFGDYVFCKSECSFQTQNRTCSSDLSKNGSIRYYYRIYTPLDVLTKIIDTIVKTAEDAAGGITDILKYLKYAIIVFIILFGIGLLVGILKKIFGKSE